MSEKESLGRGWSDTETIGQAEKRTQGCAKQVLEIAGEIESLVGQRLAYDRLDELFDDLAEVLLENKRKRESNDSV